MIREAAEGEVNPVGIEFETAFVAEQDGKITGYICMSRIQVKDGLECWIHMVEASGMDAVALMVRARKQASEWGFSEVWGTFSNPKLAMALRDHGWTLEQVILKGKTRK